MYKKVFVIPLLFIVVFIVGILFRPVFVTEPKFSNKNLPIPENDARDFEDEMDADDSVSSQENLPADEANPGLRDPGSIKIVYPKSGDRLSAGESYDFFISSEGVIDSSKKYSNFEIRLHCERSPRIQPLIVHREREVKLHEISMPILWQIPENLTEGMCTVISEYAVGESADLGGSSFGGQENKEEGLYFSDTLEVMID